jgi:hypothetical protein
MLLCWFEVMYDIRRHLSLVDCSGSVLSSNEQRSRVVFCSTMCNFPGPLGSKEQKGYLSRALAVHGILLRGGFIPGLITLGCQTSPKCDAWRHLGEVLLTATLP